VSGSFSIRNAVEADLERCVALALLAAPEPGAESWKKALAADLEDLDRLLVVAEANGGIAGYGRARLFEPAPDAPADSAPRGYYLTGIFVLRAERSRGIGTALTQARLDWVCRRSAEAWFFANARNNASIELHRRLGFEEITRRFSFPGLTFDGGEGVLFRRRLAEPL
jgi:ribosomal protein S18 acetylase RimI-like enzyme